MRKIAIDTNVYSAFKENDSSIKKLFQRVEFIGIDITVIAELYSGFKMGNRETQNREELALFINSPRVEVLYHDLETAEFYAFIGNSLRKKGKSIPTNDIWIAATSLRHGLALASSDRLFKEIDGLMLIHPGNP